MTVQECYEGLHGNYREAKQRLMGDSLVERFMLKFLSDNSMDTLREAIRENNNEKAFRAAHTLKGVAANMAFTELRNAASELTEQLRTLEKDPDPVLVEKVEASYKLVVDTISSYSSERNES